MTPKTFFFISLLFSSTAISQPKLLEADIEYLQTQMNSKQLTSVQLTQFYLDRIKQHDPELNAIISLNPHALAQAEAADLQRTKTNDPGKMLGIPVLLKDNIETADPMATTAGSLALQDNITLRDATLVKNLRAAGAVILGKANLSEWANFRSERSSSGWSGVKGQTHNPYHLSKSPCGSSSGSGVAASANLAAVTIGTETNGSIVCPASANGVVGLKPTVGLVSRTGVVPLSHSQDTAGPMTRTVSDAATLLNAMQGADVSDPASQLAKKMHNRDYTASLKSTGLQNKKIGVLRSSAGFHTEVDALFNQAITDLKAAGAVLVDDLQWETPDGFWDASYDVLLYEFKHDLNQYLANRPKNLPLLTLAQLIAFNENHKSTEMRWFGQEIFIKSQAKNDLSDPEYLAALKLIQSATQEDGIDALLKAHDLDLIIAPTGAPAWSIDKINGDHFIGGSSSLAAISGYPSITVPMGYIHGLPVGISFFAGAFQEPVIIEAAYAYEQKTSHRKAPTMNNWP